MGFLKDLFGTRKAKEVNKSATENQTYQHSTKAQKNSFDPELYIHKKLQEMFDDNVSYVFEQNGFSDHSATDALRVQSAIAVVYQQMQNNEGMIMLCALKGISSQKYNEILDEECTKALAKYLQ